MTIVYTNQLQSDIISNDYIFNYFNESRAVSSPLYSPRDSRFTDWSVPYEYQFDSKKAYDNIDLRDFYLHSINLYVQYAV